MFFKKKPKKQNKNVCLFYVLLTSSRGGEIQGITHKWWLTGGSSASSYPNFAAECSSGGGSGEPQGRDFLWCHTVGPTNVTAHVHRRWASSPSRRSVPPPLHACLLTCVFACLFTCLLIYLLAYLLTYLLALLCFVLLVCLLACLLAYLLARKEKKTDSLRLGRPAIFLQQDNSEELRLAVSDLQKQLNKFGAFLPLLCWSFFFF